MGIKKIIVLLIFAAIYITFMTYGIIITVISTDFFHLIYDTFTEMAKIGIFFFIYLIILLFVIPGIYFNLIVHKKDFKVKESKKTEAKNNKSICILLLTIGIPIMIWSIIGTYRYYAITEYYGGLGEFALNGFLIFLEGCILFFIIPGLILGIRRYGNNFEEKDFNQ